jgi:type II restriction enzyme
MMEENRSQKAIDAALKGEQTFCKFLSANDSGESGAHQAGIYIPKTSVSIAFDVPGVKGANKERWANIDWQDGEVTTSSRFIYYGQGTRNEYRLTNFGREFPYIHPEYTGALFVLVKTDPEDYRAFILNTDDEIQQFLDFFGLTPAETNRLIDIEKTSAGFIEEEAFDNFIRKLDGNFPASEEMSKEARIVSYGRLINRNITDLSAEGDRINQLVVSDPDKILLDWTEEEFRLFRAIENYMYGEKVKKGFSTVDDFIILANKVLNRRKSRAGKSLEHHLAAIFDGSQIRYTAQAITEGNKRPDFIFPSEEDYHNTLFPIDKLCSLAAKTTCKDRWRQILNEGDRFRGRYKYLCTMQQGISFAQMDEMESEKVILVVPKPYISSYPHDRQSRIWTISHFVGFVREMEGI